MTRIFLKFVLSNGATDGYAKIDRQGVKIVNGRGEKDVDTAADYHTVTLVFEGTPGGTLDYELTENLGTLVKGKLAISHGQKEGVVSGRFKLKSVG